MARDKLVKAIGEVFRLFMSFDFDLSLEQWINWPFYFYPSYPYKAINKNRQVNVKKMNLLLSMHFSAIK